MGARVYNFDKDLQLKDAGLVAASAAAQVGGSNKIIDLGNNSRMDGMVVLDISAIEVASNDEEYDVILQGSSSATFASNIQNLAQMNLGATAVRQGGAITSLVGRYEMPFTNEQANVTYRYVRLFTVVAGTVATGINYTGFIAKQPGR